MSGKTRTRQSCPDFRSPCLPTSDWGEKQHRCMESFENVFVLDWPDVTWSSVNCYFRFEYLVQADKPTLIGYCGHLHFDHLVSRLLLAISRSVRSKTENAKTSHSRLDQLSEISFWKNKKNGKISPGLENLWHVTDLESPVGWQTTKSVTTETWKW